jgi:hypothetical protein
MTGKFIGGDICSFQISMPSNADPNDVLFIRAEYFQYASATLLKGTSIWNLVSRYSDIGPG